MTSLVLFGTPSGPEIGVLEKDRVTPSGLPATEWASILNSWGSDTATVPAVGRAVSSGEVELLPPLSGASRVFCVAQNYPAHAAEAGGDSPPTPIVFMKPVEAFVGQNGTARLPEVSNFFDYEGEIAVVIGRGASSIGIDEAAQVIAGYTIANDGSARDLQPATLADRHQVDWFAAKSFDRGSALGPGVVSASAIIDPTKLRLRTWHNGELVQEDVTASMYHPIPNLVSFVSQIVALRAGDVILTGTPAGVGKARGVRLNDQDVVTVSVDGIGVLTTTYANVREAPAAIRATVGSGLRL